jgi:hypothetical protein
MCQIVAERGLFRLYSSRESAWVSNPTSDNFFFFLILVSFILFHQTFFFPLVLFFRIF